MSADYSVWVSMGSWYAGSTQGIPPAPGDRCVLADPFSYAWGWQDEQIPGHLEPSTAQVTLAARTAADLPPANVGDLLTLNVWAGELFGPAATLMVRETHRVTDVAVTLDPTADWAARMTITTADLLVDLRGAPVPETPLAGRNNGYESGFGEMAWVSGYRICAPQTWPNPAGPAVPFPDPAVICSNYWAANNMAELLTSHAASLARGGVPVTIAPHFGTATPPDYWPGVDYPTALWATSTPYPVPDGLVRFALVSTSRTFPGPAPLPLRLTGPATSVTVDVAQAPVGMGGQLLTLNADWCRVPATARRDRSHAPTAAVIGMWTMGEVTYSTDNLLDPNYRIIERADDTAVDVEYRPPTIAPPVAKVVATRRTYRYVATREGAASFLVTQHPEIAKIGAAYLPDASARVSWAFDAFTLRPDLMDPASRAAILPRIMPAPPGTDRDGHVVRHVTLHGIHPSTRMDAEPVMCGFITTGTFTIEGGSMTFQLTLAPGVPSLPDAAALTVAELAASTYSTTRVRDLEPGIRVAHLRLTRA